MANEVKIRTSITIKSGNLVYRTGSSGFQADMSGAKGPTPGAIDATEDGVDVDLSELLTPGLCVLKNLEADGGRNAEFGRWDSDFEKFYPLIYLLPGEQYVIRLSSNVTEEYTGTGTGTTDTASTFRVKGIGGTAAVSIEAFES